MKKIVYEDETTEREGRGNRLESRLKEFIAGTKRV